MATSANTRRDETFRIDEDGDLVHGVRTTGGYYEHRCDRETFKAVCHAIDECHRGPFVYEELVAATGAPHSRVATAYAFLRERGCIVPTSKRRHKAASADVYLDGLTEFSALESGDE